MADQAQWIEGQGKARIQFEDLDQFSLLKTRTFVRLCMPPIFKELEARLPLAQLRGKGIVPIMFNLGFRTTPHPLVLMSQLDARFRVGLRRSISAPEQPGGVPMQRLLLLMECDLSGPRSSGDPTRLGADTHDAPHAPAGTMRALQVWTRLLAPPGQRQVVEVPPELATLRELPLEEPFPAPEPLLAIPEGYQRIASGQWEQHESVFGLPNTDINQHVNVQEYLMGMENHFVRLLHGADLPQLQHRITAVTTLFRRPFFPGDRYRIQGPLWRQGQRTLLAGSFHKVSREGQTDPRPSAVVRLEGHLLPGG